MPDRPRTMPTNAGIASGIDAILDVTDRIGRKVDNLSIQVDELQAKVVLHGADIRQLRGDVAELKTASIDHNDRLVELERLPRPHRATSIPPLSAMGTEVRGTEAARKELPSGSWILDPDAADRLSKQIAAQNAADNWRAIVKGAWKVVLGVAIIVIAFVVKALLSR